MSPRKPKPGRDLATLRPDLAKEANGWDPKTVSAQSNEKLAWRCKRGHSWSAVVCNRFNGNGCSACSKRTLAVGVNDLLSINPDLAAEANGWGPVTVAAWSNVKREWRCGEGHTWDATVNSRSRGSGCPYCAKREVIAGINDLATTNPKLAGEAHGWDASTVTSWTHRKREWKCVEGHVWTARVGRRYQGAGCPSCAETGFDPNLPGYLYLIEHLGEDLLQIGISNHPAKRLKDHSSRGWTPIEVQGPWGIGEVAHQWEQGILKYLHSHGAVSTFDAGLEKFNGCTEAWLRESFPATSLSELRRLVDDEEWDLQESA